MSLPSKMITSLLVINSCTPQHKQETSPNTYPVPLFYAPPEEAHPSCVTEAVYCNYYSDYGPVFVYKCRDSKNKSVLYTLETTPYKEKRWYQSTLQQDINNQTFSEYCKNSFDNYRWFMQETE